MGNHPQISCQSIEKKNQTLLVFRGRASDQTGRLDTTAAKPSRGWPAKQLGDFLWICVQSRGPLFRSECERARSHGRHRHVLIVEDGRLAVWQIIVKVTELSNVVWLDEAGCEIAFVPQSIGVLSGPEIERKTSEVLGLLERNNRSRQAGLLAGVV
jgi:hypothetical protein